MNNRMEKYDGKVEIKERTAKNKKLYDEVSSMNIDFIDEKADIDTNSIEIDKNNLPKTRSDYQKLRGFEDIISNKKDPEVRVEKADEEMRVYDINEILKLARDNKLFDTEERKRLINTEYNILAKLNLDKIDEEEELSKESLRELIDNVYSNESDKKKKKEKKNDKDLFSDLVSDNIDENSFFATEETEKEKTDLLREIAIDKTEEIEITEEIEATNEISEVSEKYDTEEIDEEDDDEYVSNSKVGIIILILMIIGLLATGGYFLYQYFIQ